MISGSIEITPERRLSNLYIESHDWLLRVAKHISGTNENAEDLVSELYEYLHIKQNVKINWGNSINIMYCSKFLKHRWLNKVKKLNRISYVEEVFDTELDIPYNVEEDLRLENAHNEVLSELKRLEKTKGWASSKIFELYYMSDKTLDEVASDIGISKSTTFLAVKKIRKHLKSVIENPYE
jgi:RNA polymerase sigma factor (sigma-70 family)